jgi:hypothetical protein
VAALSASDLHTRARAGELDALKQIEGRPAKDRSIDDALALAAGHRVLLARDVEALGADLRREPALAADPTVLARLADLARDPEAAPHALPIVAALPAPVGPDLLHEIATESRHPATSALAADLLEVPSVRAKTSKALESVLELEAATRCERVRQLLPKVREHGDRRALPRLKQLAKKTGCGRERKDDCWECLRGDDLIAGSREVLAKKKPPRPWAIRRR